MRDDFILIMLMLSPYLTIPLSLPLIMLVASPPVDATEMPATILKMPSDFDAGINSSAAWTAREPPSPKPPEDERIDGRNTLVLPDIVTADVRDIESEPYDIRLARVVYDFVGKREFQELSVRAGEELEILEESLSDGWSLARQKRESGSEGDTGVGLIPRSYYVVSREYFVRIEASFLLVFSSRRSSSPPLAATTRLCISGNLLRSTCKPVQGFLNLLSYLKIQESGFELYPISAVVFLVGRASTVFRVLSRLVQKIGS
jgi:hypothetical protein